MQGYNNTDDVIVMSLGLCQFEFGEKAFVKERLQNEGVQYEGRSVEIANILYMLFLL